MNRKYIFIVIFLILSLNTIFSEISLKESKFSIEPNYYGLPLNIRFGYKYRQNDWGLFPFLGFNFSFDNSYSLTSLAGIRFNIKQFQFTSEFHYELLPSLISKNHIFYNYNRLDFKTQRAGIYIPFFFGKRKHITENNEVDIYDTGSLGIGSDIFLAETGFLKNTVHIALNFSVLPSEKFTYYDITVLAPLTLYFSTIELGFLYSAFYIQNLKIKNISPAKNFNEGKTFAAFTNRLNFSSQQKKYNIIQAFEIEPRWYFLRTIDPFSCIYLSTFANGGIGITKSAEVDLLYQVGGGIGYTLFDSVPFEFQLGYDNQSGILLYIGGISRIMHRP